MSFFAWRVCARSLAADAPPALEGIELRPLDAKADLRHFAPPLLLSAAKAREGFARGEVCIGAFHERSLVGYVWFAHQRAPHLDGVWMAFDSRAVYIYRAFVLPSYRGRGIAPALYGAGDPLFRSQGRGSALLCIGLGHAASFAAARRSGARTVGYGAYFRAGRVLLQLRTPGAVRAGYRFYLPPERPLSGAR